MLSLFLDTNVFLDHLLARSPNEGFAKLLLRHAEERLVNIATSSSSIINIIYFLKRAGMKTADITPVIEDLLLITEIINPDNKTISTSLHSGFPDLEDAIQYYTALHSGGINYFVTSSHKDDKKAIPLLPVISLPDMVAIIAL